MKNIRDEHSLSSPINQKYIFNIPVSPAQRWEAQRVGGSALMGLTGRPTLCADKGVGPKKGEKLEPAARQLDWGRGGGVCTGSSRGEGAGRGRSAIGEGRGEQRTVPGGELTEAQQRPRRPPGGSSTVAAGVGSHGWLLSGGWKPCFQRVMLPE